MTVGSVSRPAMTKASVENDPTVPSRRRAMKSSMTEWAMAVATKPSP